MNLAINARRDAECTHRITADAPARPRATPGTRPLALPWFVRAGLVLAAYQAHGAEGGL